MAISFELNETQRLIKDTVRQFAENELRAHALEWDENEHFPADVFTKMGELGFMGIAVSEDYGGAGYGAVETALVVEELARVEPGIALSVAAHNSLCTGHINLYGTAAQKKRYLPSLASGRKWGAWGLTEPGSGSDAAGLQTTAEPTGEGDYILNGSKNFITFGSQGHVYVIMALTDRTKRRHGGITAFIVERGTEGLIPGKPENKMGMRTSDTASLLLDNCRVPAENIIGGQPGRGFDQFLGVLTGGRIGIGALGVGIAQGSYEEATKYAQTRKQFGRPLAAFQAIQFKLAEMATQIEAARLLVYRAAWLKDQGKACIKEAAMAKLYASEVAVRVVEEALQIHGGYGYIKDYPVEKYYRDAKLCTIGEGTSEIQRIVIARQVIKEARMMSGMVG